MIYIPTLTNKLRQGMDMEYENILYSPNKYVNTKFKAKNITIWDNYTFYLLRRCQLLNKQEFAYNHYIWFVDFVNQNWEEGITVITPDVEWHCKQDEIEKLWLNKCSHIPQLYIPNTWINNTSKLNIVGHALRKNQSSELADKKWTHCLGHTRKDLTSNLLTYDSISCKF